MEGNGTTWAGTLTDDAGTIHVVFCDVCRGVRIDSQAPGRRAWNVTYVREGPFRARAQHRRDLSGGSRVQSLLGQLRALLGIPPSRTRARGYRAAP